MWNSVFAPGMSDVTEARTVPCLPEGDEWNHELKFDGFRSRIVRDAEGVRIFTRCGSRSPYPSITARSHPVMASKSIDFVVSTSNSGPRRGRAALG